MCIARESPQSVIGLPPVGHSRLLAVVNSLPGLNYGPKKSDWLNCPSPWESIFWNRNGKKSLLVEIPTNSKSSLSKKIEILMFSIGNVLLTFCEHKSNQSINQSNKQFIVARLLSMRRRIIKQTPDQRCPWNRNNRRGLCPAGRSSRRLLWLHGHLCSRFEYSDPDYLLSNLFEKN